MIEELGFTIFDVLLTVMSKSLGLFDGHCSFPRELLREGVRCSPGRYAAEAVLADPVLLQETDSRGTVLHVAAAANCRYVPGRKTDTWV